MVRQRASGLMYSRARHGIIWIASAPAQTVHLSSTLPVGRIRKSLLGDCRDLIEGVLSFLVLRLVSQLSKKVLSPQIYRGI